MKQFSIILISLFMVAACKHDPEDMPVLPTETPDTTQTDTLPEDTSGCDTANVTYSVTIKKVLNDNCLRCHGSTVYTTKGSGYNFDDYSVIKDMVDNGKLTKSINHSPGAVPMPLDQTAKMSDCEIRKIMIWIEDGAPQN